MKTASKFQKKSLAVAVATATVLAASTSPVFGAEGAMLEEVLVTATRRSQSVQDIPFNISAVSGDSLDKAGIVD
jgi:iron complex outermembrane receptor protein